MGKYTKTHAELDSTALALKKLNDLHTQMNSLLAKLDADTGVAGTDYLATLQDEDLGTSGTVEGNFVGHP